MKLETNTLNILKNFAKINSSILINTGDVLKTISPSKTIMANAKAPNKFEQKFAIYNLDRFISAVSLFDNPDLKFTDKYVDISDGQKKTRYMYADENTVTKAPNKEIKLPSEDVVFELTAANFKEVEKAASVLSLPEIVVRGDGTNITLQAVNVKEKSASGEQGGDIYSVVVGETDKKFTAIFKFENIKIVPGDYKVTLSSKGISKFESSNLPFEISYFIAIESNSSFE